MSDRCPHPLLRAPRATRAPNAPPTDQLHLPPPELTGALVAILTRDTRGLGLDDAQRLSHFPASPLFSLSWYLQEVPFGLVAEPGWRPFGAGVVISGSQSAPLVSWAPAAARGGMVCFTADVARSLFGLDPARLHDRFVPAREVLDARWQPLCDALLAASDDAATLTALRTHIAPRWLALQGRGHPAPSLRQLGRHWVGRLAWQAHEWRRTHSPRQVERRIKSLSGRSLREWQSLVRTEGVFFAARDRHEAGQPFDWAGLAQEQGFADQSHLVRSTRRITGFAPGEFTQRFLEDESFWLYRLWV